MLQLTLTFEGGSLVLDPSSLDAAAELELDPSWVFDERISRWRAPADAYREVFAELYLLEREGKIALIDEARAYDEVPLRFLGRREPRPYQAEAVDAWLAAGKRGQVILPTGAGKSYVAQLIMQRVQRSTLVVVPTIDLMNQWYDGLLAAFDLDEVGLLGGGYHEPLPVTVTTYDSAYIHMERYGNRFALVVFDEVHHLPGRSYLMAATQMIAPFRLGLTATPERQDGRHTLIDDAVGDVAYRREIKELAGEFLSDYETVQLTVTLTPDEYREYIEARETYLGFVRKAGISFSRRERVVAVHHSIVAVGRRPPRDEGVPAPEAHGVDVFAQDRPRRAAPGAPRRRTRDRVHE